jgi:hypothetical protein
MKVIKDNYNKFPMKVTCERCDSVIELENEDDLSDNGYSEFYWLCPLCKNRNYVENF